MKSNMLSNLRREKVIQLSFEIAICSFHTYCIAFIPAFMQYFFLK